MAMTAVYRRRMHASSVSTHRPTHAQAPASTMINILGVSHVFAHVRQLPRKLVCLFDPSSSSASAREQQVRPVSQISSPCDSDYVAHTTTSNLGRGGYDDVIDSGYAYECPSYGHLPSSSTCAVSASQSPTLWNPVLEDAAADSVSSPAASPNFSKSSINDSRISMPIPTRPAPLPEGSRRRPSISVGRDQKRRNPVLPSPRQQIRLVHRKPYATIEAVAEASHSIAPSPNLTRNLAAPELRCTRSYRVRRLLLPRSALYTPGADDESKTNEGASVNAKLDAAFSNPDFDATPKPALDPAPASTATSRSRILSKRKRSFPVRRVPFNHVLSTSTQ
ncbi:hypothetical protein DFH11DRAFT_1778394 [Phellopilus nigrolimitatus]|nr:hypothetical protein DFH11DRAFT_1778394 [Phellopilus nigrolimitatus]